MAFLRTGMGDKGAVRGFVIILDCWQISHTLEMFLTSTNNLGQ